MTIPTSQAQLEHFPHAALDELRLADTLDSQIWDYLVAGAHSLVKAFPEGTPDADGRSDLGITPA